MSSDFRYWGVIDEICEKLRKGQVYLAEPLIRKLVCRIFHYAGIVNSITGKDYTIYLIKKILDENCSEIYRDSIISMISLSDYDRNKIDLAFRQMMIVLLPAFDSTNLDAMSRLPSHFMIDSTMNQILESERNVYVDSIGGRRIQFDTIHGVKGETHDATLYLETEYKNNSDIARVLPWFEAGKVASTQVHDYSRKMVYVGMSRPRKLLCLAIQEKTYNKSKNAFQNWEIIDLRKQ